MQVFGMNDPMESVSRLAGGFVDMVAWSDIVYFIWTLLSSKKLFLKIIKKSGQIMQPTDSPGLQSILKC